MKDFKIKAEVIANFNDSKDANKPYEIGDEIVLNRARFEELSAKGFVKQIEKVKEEKKQKNEDKD
jgi:hypothetical protein